MTPEQAHQIGVRAAAIVTCGGDVAFSSAEMIEDFENMAAGLSEERMSDVALSHALRGVASFLGDLKAEVEARAAALESTR